MQNVEPSVDNCFVLQDQACAKKYAQMLILNNYLFLYYNPKCRALR